MTEESKYGFERAMQRAYRNGFKGGTIGYYPTRPNVVEYEEYKKWLMNPEFWRCLGVAERWEEKMVDGTPYLTYRTHWKDLVDHLSDGGEVNDFFDKLLK